jgi:hypothetical protein
VTTHFGAIEGVLPIATKFVNVSASPTLELTLIEPYHSMEYGQLYVAHCVPKQ